MYSIDENIYKKVLRCKIGRELLESEFVEGRSISSLKVREYIDTQKLRQGTEVKGPIEFAIKKVLLKHNPKIESYYHIFPFTTDDLTSHTPDFLLPQIKVDGKFLILNPHHFRMDDNNNILDSEIVKWTGFQKAWGHQFHNLIVSFYSQKELVKQIGVKDIKDFASGSWKLPNHGKPVKELIPVIRERLQEVFRRNDVTYNKVFPVDELVCCLQRAQRIRDLQMGFMSKNERFKAANTCLCPS
jgi:hypothetical protein